MGAPACPGVPWGLAFETWDPCHRSQMETPLALEVILQSKLQLSIVDGGRGYPAEITGALHPRRSRKLGIVQSVECLDAKLHALSFERHWEGPVNSQGERV